MMNPGEFNEKIKIRALKQTGNTYQWEPVEEVWGKAETLKDPRTLFGRRAFPKALKFIVRKCPISLANTVEWNGQDCFLTDITEIDRMYYAITAVLFESKLCTVFRTITSLDPLNRPVASSVSKLIFPGCLIEINSKKSQGKPMALVEVRYRLAVPGVVELLPGQLVEIEGVEYEVWTPRSCSVYKKEYEIRIRKDA